MYPLYSFFVRAKAQEKKKERSIKVKKFLALVLSLMMCLSLFAACGKSDDNATDTQGSENNTQGETTGTETAEQHFRTFISAEPSTLDVSRRSDTYSSSILVNTVESLVRCELRDGEYVTCPGDAESWEVDETGTVWTFHLNENAKWEDGEPVTADQYVYSLRRSSAPETGCPNAFFLQPIKNFSKVNSGELAVEELGVEAKDEHTLVITLENALPAYLDMLSSTIYYAQREDIVEKYGDKYGADAETFISNGPFKVESWTHNNSIVLTKNENYWDADSVKLEKVTREDHLGVFSGTGDDGLDFMRGEILRFVNDEKDIPEASSPDVGQRGNQDFLVLEHSLNSCCLSASRLEIVPDDIQVVHQRLDKRPHLAFLVPRQETDVLI